MCKRDLVEGRPGAESNLSEMAHIHGVAGGSARHDPSMSHVDVNKRSNLILLCAACHKIVDDDPVAYTPDRLEKIKSDHEEWARRQLIRDSKFTSFAELAVVAKWLTTAPPAGATTDYAVTPPLEKIRKNGLSEAARSWIEIGMSKSHLVGRFMEAQPDPSFGERLRDGFLAVYRDLRAGEDLDSDSAFFRMLDMSRDMQGAGALTPAVLAVMVYFFEKCEVFEK